MNEKNTKARLEELLHHDKEDMNEVSKQAALADLLRVAGEYFDIDGNGTLTVKRGKGNYEVTFSFRAVRVKNFSVLQ